jgi:ribosome-binding ATPase YchF (GTP1/OBG family)
VILCGKIEAELAEVTEPAEKAELLAAYGLKEPALASLARECYRLLGLQSYFTAGEKEVRAWTVRKGALAPEAAGVIHTDFEKGFIRAQVYSIPDLEALGSEAAIKAAGKMRMEGKDYVVQDGDVMHFLFNV